MPPFGDLQYNEGAHQELGSEIWWLRRVDDDGALVVTGELSYIKVDQTGSGYDTAPTVGFSGGGGTGAAATALISGGKVFAVLITNVGSGYTSAPTIAFTPTGTGSGAAATAVIKDKWHLAFGRLKSNVDYGQEETPVFGEGGHQFSTKKEDVKGELTFTSLQDDVDTENFLAKEVGKWKWAIFQHCGLSKQELGLDYHKYRYFGIVKIPNKYASEAQGREVEMKGYVLDNKSAITVTEASLPIATLQKAYDLAAHEMVATQDEVVAPSI